MERHETNSVLSASNAAIAHSVSVRAMGNLTNEDDILFDLVDLEKIFKVTKRTLYNWRSKNILNFITFGGKPYLTKKALHELIAAKEGGVL